MARSATTPSATVRRSKKEQQQLLPEGSMTTTPRQPRRRKQPTTTTTTTKTPMGRLTMMKEDEYSFASSSSSSTAATSGRAANENSKKGRSTTSARTGKKAADEKENAVNVNVNDNDSYGQKERKKTANDKDEDEGSVEDEPQATSRSTKKSSNITTTSKSRRRRNCDDLTMMDNLNESMAKFNLENKNENVDNDNASVKGKRKAERGRETSSSSRAAKTDKQPTRRNCDPMAMDDLSDSMAKVDLGNDKKDKAAKVSARKMDTEYKYKASPFPPKGLLFGAQNNNIIMALSTARDGRPNSILKRAIQTIDKSKENESVCKVFHLISSLVEAVASASYSTETTESMLLLEENTSKLIDAAKRSLKSLSSSSSSSGKSSKSKKPDSSSSSSMDTEEDELEMALLRIAVYSLRAILPTLLESSVSSKSRFTACQVVIKLFYHCVVIAGDACHKKFQSFTDKSLSKKDNGSSSIVMIMEYAMLCLGAYEGLGKCLEMGSSSSSKQSKSKTGTVPWDEMITVPSATSRSSTSKSKAVLPHRQLVKIIMESSLCASSSFLYMSLISLHTKAKCVEEENKWTLPDEFRFASNVVFETCSGEHEEKPTFLKMMTNVAMPCVIQSLFMAQEDEDCNCESKLTTSSLFDVDALRHVKKAFRLLWDGSRCVEDVYSNNNNNVNSKDDASALQMCRLDLQSEAILFILQSFKEVFRLCPNVLDQVSASGAKEIVALFDRASSSALKSAGLFEKSTNVFASTVSKTTKDGDSSSSRKRKNSAALLHFHGVVGDELDEIALHLCPEKCRRHLPASYYEFSVYRSIHQWRLLGSAATKHTQTSSFVKITKHTGSDEIESMVGMSTFAIVNTVLQARHILKHDGATWGISDSDCERAISNFELVVLNNSPPASLTRCRSMLMLLDLPKEASKIMSSVQSGRDESNYSEKGWCIAAMASVLGRCLAPLEAKLARAATKDQSRSLSFRLSAADHRARSAALYDVALENPYSLMSEKSREKIAAEADLQLGKSYEILLNELNRLEKSHVDRKAPPVVAIETFAKTATFVGSRRSNRKDVWASMQPHIFASEILTKVAIRAPGKGLFEAYQIPNRFKHLSSVLEANGCIVESCAALAMAAWCSIENMAAQSSAKSTSDADEVEGDSIAEEILLFPQNAIFGTISQDDNDTSGLSQIIQRLTRAYIKHRKPPEEEYSQDKNAECSRDTLSQTLRSTLIGKVLEASCSSTSSENESFSTSTDKPALQIRLSKLLHCAIWNQKRYEEELSAAQLANIVRDVLKSTTKVFTKSNRTDDDNEPLHKHYSHFIEELTVFLKAQKRRLGDSIDPDLLQVLSSSFHVSFAAHLVDSRLLSFPRPSSWVLRKSLVEKRKSKLVQYSCMQLQCADKQFTAASLDEDSGHDACFFAQWAAVKLQYAILLEHTSLAKLSADECVNDGSNNIHAMVLNYSSALSIGSHAVGQLCESDEEVYPEVVESLLMTLKRLLCWFISYSVPISATECFVLLQKVYSLLEQPQSFIGAVFSFLSVSSKFDDFVRTLISHTESVCLDSNVQFDSDLQYVADSLDLIVKMTEKPTGASSLELEEKICELIESVEPEMEDLLEDTDDEAMESDMCSKIDLLINKQLFVTTMLMLYAKLCLDAGQSRSAVKYLGWCRIQCRKFMTFLRFASCHLNDVTLDDTTVQVNDLLLMCYEQLASAFYLLGIRRKAEDHVFVAVVKQKIPDIGQNVARTNMQDLIDAIEDYDGLECFLRPIRLFTKIKALSTSPDKMTSLKIFMDKAGSTMGVDLACKRSRVNQVLCKSKNALAYDDSFRHVPDFRAKKNLFLGRVYKEVNRYANLNGSTDVAASLGYFTNRVGIDLKLRMLRNPDSGLFCSDSADESIAAALKEISDSRFGSGICNAEAYYRLGLIALQKARHSGELQTLWKGHAIFLQKEDNCCADSGDCTSSHLPHTLDARRFYRCALLNAPHASYGLTKNILRCLALVTGPEDGHSDPGSITGSLINISVGGTARNIVLDELEEGKARDAFEIFDDETLDHNARVEAVGKYLTETRDKIPPNWKISTLATCPSGEVLICSLRVSVSETGGKSTEISTACIFPASREGMDDNSNIGIYDDVLSPLDRVIERSQKQLHGMTEEAQNEHYNEESSRRKWWKKRRSIDEDLQSLLEYAETKYFRHEAVRQTMLPDKRQNAGFNVDDDSSECSDLGPGNLASRFDEAKHEASKPEFDKETERLHLTKLTVSEIKSKLVSFGVTKFKKMRKAELIDLILSKMECRFDIDNIEALENEYNEATEAVEANSPQEYEVRPDKVQAEPCTILVLDEHLLRFPFESMDMFSDVTVTRVPSLPFVLATLIETESLHSTSIPKVDARKVKYVIDPESNLSESASTLGPALDSLASKNGWEWEGVMGHMPSSEFMLQALKEENGLYLYCGHGGGEKAFSRSQVEDLMTGRIDGIRGCRAPIVLMGCSSGKLHSVNIPKDAISGRVHDMHYEPEGIALSFLLAGAPCVVGNLWDVTDRDIDRYCLTLMEDFLQTEGVDSSPRSLPSLAKCVASARRACKLRFIVGSAPVCYGVPIYNDTSM